MSETFNPRSEKAAAFIFGVFFILLILGLAIAFPRPTDVQYFVFRLILSLSAAGVAATLPGAFHINVRVISRGTLRAGGALAVFFFVYTTNPAIISTLGVKPQLPPDEALDTVKQYLSLIDAQKFPDAYKLFGSREQQMASESTYSIAAAAQRSQVGDTVSRQGPIQVTAPSMQNNSDNQQISFAFSTQFKHLPTPVHEIVNLEAENHQWRVMGYFIQP